MGNERTVLYCGHSIPGGLQVDRLESTGFQVDSRWNVKLSSGFQVDLGGFQWIPGGFRWTPVDSVGIQHIPGGFQVDSRWTALNRNWSWFFRVIPGGQVA